MLFIAATIDPAVERAMHFTTAVLGAASVVFYSIDDGAMPYDFVLQNVSREFHAEYMAGMIENDPLSVKRLAAQSLSVASLHEEGQKLDPASFKSYRDFLETFGRAEAVEFIFRRQGVMFAGMNITWPESRRSAPSPSPALDAIHSYMEFNLARSAVGERPAAQKLLQRFGFTAREREVVGLLCCGRTNQEIAGALQISRATVKTHLIHIFNKMGAENRTCAVAMLSRVH